MENARGFLPGINQRLNFFESKTGLLPASLLSGLVLLLLAALYITPKFIPAFNGVFYARLSEDPFLFEDGNDFRFRMLPCLVGYVTGLRGDLFVVFMLFITWLFLSSAYFIYRRKNFDPVDSLLFAGILAGSCTVFIQLVSPAYTDTFFYLFVLLAFASAHRPALSAVCLSIALLSHESVLFLIPGYLLYGLYKNKGSLQKQVVVVAGTIVSVVLLFGFRAVISQYTAIKYDLTFYVHPAHIHDNIHKVFAMAPAGVFYAFRLFWVFPLIAILLLWKEKEWYQLLMVAAILTGAMMQLAVSFDITRHLALAFPAILISAEMVRAKMNGKAFTLLAVMLTLLNLMILPYYASPEGLHRLF